MTRTARHCLPQIIVTGTLWTLKTSGQGHKRYKHHLQLNTQTHRPDRSVSAVCQSLFQAACALCLRLHVAHERLSQSMGGSLDSACALDGCPIRGDSTLNSVCLIRKDRLSQTQLRAEELNSADRQFWSTGDDYPPISLL